ncbi:MAG: hypothetical protein Kow0063_18590 [Anaerolineae bacterium]
MTSLEIWSGLLFAVFVTISLTLHIADTIVRAYISRTRAIPVQVSSEEDSGQGHPTFVRHKRKRMG